MSFKGEKYDAHSDTQLSSLQCDGNLLPKIQKLKMNVRLMLVHLVYYCLRNNVAGSSGVMKVMKFHIVASKVQ